MSLGDEPDADLASRSVAGDETALAEIYRRHRGTIFRFALMLSGSPSAADDLTQQVFLEWITRRARFEPKRGSLPAFLCGVTRMLARKRHWFETATEIDESPERAAEAETPADDPLAQLEAGERQMLVRQAIRGLPRHYREVVALCFMEEMSHAEAARVLEVKPATVDSRLTRARALLLARLAHLAKEAKWTTRSKNA